MFESLLATAVTILALSGATAALFLWITRHHRKAMRHDND